MALPKATSPRIQSFLKSLPDTILGSLALNEIRQSAKLNERIADAPLPDADKNLIPFALSLGNYNAEPAHRLIGDYLDAVVAGEVKRLMIFAPPQHGKSELISIRFPAYWFGRRPNDPVILASYGASLAKRNSSAARDIVESDKFKWIFPNIKTDARSRAVEFWKLSYPNRGAVKASGIGGPLTGFGGMLGVIDDPIKDWKSAQSPTIRENFKSWYKSTFRTRIWQSGAIILLMTRWHPDDAAGWLLKQGIEDWTVLRLPALAETQEERDENNKQIGLPPGQNDPLGREPGKALCPNRFDEAALNEIKGDVGSIVWPGCYQGVPREAEGNRFKREWFEIVRSGAPADAKRVRYWDNAATEDGGKYTAGVLLSEHNGIIYVEDVARGQWSTGTRNDNMIQVATMDLQRGHVEQWFEQEPGSAGKDAVDYIVKMMAGFSIHSNKETGDKDIRLEPFAAQAEARNVKLVEGRWNYEYIEEMIAVPNSPYRDQADGSAGAYNKIRKVGKYEKLW